jgi:hypothetical protein
VILLPHAASDSALTVLHPPKNSLSLSMSLLSGLFIFIRVLVIGEAAVLILDGLFKVLTLLVGQALEFIDGGLIAADGSVIIAACGHLGCVEGDSLLFPTCSSRVTSLILRSAKVDQILMVSYLFLVLLAFSSSFCSRRVRFLLV